MNMISNNYIWQEEKRLSSGDDFCILTDVHVSRGRYVPHAHEQRRFRVGIYDFATDRFGFLIFSSDDAFALLKARLSCAPWSSPPPVRIRYHRRSRPSRSGRLVVRAELIRLSSAERAQLAGARQVFAGTDHQPNATAGLWAKEQARATRELAIEAAIEARTGWFCRAEIVQASGYKGYQVGAALQVLRKQKRLECQGRGRGARYRWPDPVLEERVDWVA